MLKNKKASLFLHLLTDFGFTIEIPTFYPLRHPIFTSHPQNLQGRTNGVIKHLMKLM